MPRRKTKPVNGIYCPKRRAVYEAGEAVEPLVLFQAHDWTCHICKGAIDPRKRLPDWWAATIDHVIPISKGGTHVWENLKPAHAKCNWDKADKIPL